MDLTEIRNLIDEIDKQITELFCRRMDLVRDVAAYKIENNMPVLRPEREKALLEKVRELADDDYKDYTVELFEKMMELSRSMQEKIISNSHAADA